MSFPVGESQAAFAEDAPESVMAEDAGPRRYAPVPLKRTPHPPWLRSMLEDLRPEWAAASNASLFRETAAGRPPPLDAWRRFLGRCFPIVDRFPKYMGLSLSKTTYGLHPGDVSIRRWLLQNLGVEARHAEWWIDWMRATGLDPGRAFRSPLTPEVQALHLHLWETSRDGSLAEGIAATNWAIEGVTGVWTRAVAGPFVAYAQEGARVDGPALRWLRAHARYDDAHPDEALEIIKLSVGPTVQASARVVAAARQSLVLLARVFESCVEA